MHDAETGKELTIHVGEQLVVSACSACSACSAICYCLLDGVHCSFFFGGLSASEVGGRERVKGRGGKEERERERVSSEERERGPVCAR